VNRYRLQHFVAGCGASPRRGDRCGLGAPRLDRGQRSPLSTGHRLVDGSGVTERAAEVANVAYVPLIPAGVSPSISTAGPDL